VGAARIRAIHPVIGRKGAVFVRKNEITGSCLADGNNNKGNIEKRRRTRIRQLWPEL
jgi:hypothetical protein